MTRLEIKELLLEQEYGFTCNCSGCSTLDGMDIMDTLTRLSIKIQRRLLIGVQPARNLTAAVRVHRITCIQAYISMLLTLGEWDDALLRAYV
jgi:hypothetical protein